MRSSERPGANANPRTAMPPTSPEELIHLEERPDALPADLGEGQRATLLFVDGRRTPATWEREARAALERAHHARAAADHRRRQERIVRLAGMGIALLFVLALWLATGDDGPLASFAGP